MAPEEWSREWQSPICSTGSEGQTLGIVWSWGCDPLLPKANQVFYHTAQVFHQLQPAPHQGALCLKFPFTLTLGLAMESWASFKYNFHSKTTGHWAMLSLYFNFIIMEERAYWQYFFSTNNNSLGAVNSKNFNGLQLLEPYVLFLSHPQGHLEWRILRKWTTYC